MNTNEIIRFSALSKYYGKHIGIENLNLEIQQGDIFGFLGPNGAGKTTSIRIMLDLLKPTSGSVSIFGMDVRKNSKAIRQRIGYLPGSFHPYHNMKGIDFLKFSSKLRCLPFKDPANLLNLLKLSEKDLNKKIGAYSQGMKQKLGIIHAVSHQPELIILDEPSTGLDPIMQEKLYRLLIDLNKKGSTIFFSSHNLPEVEKICKTVAIVKEGKLVGFESLESLRKKKKKKLCIRLNPGSINPPEIQGTRLLSSDQHIFEYLIEDDMNKILKQVSNIAYEDLTIPEPSLEDIFLSYYEQKTQK